MKNWSLKKKIFAGILVLLVIAQFFRVDKTNPEYDASNDFLAIESAPQDMALLIKGACYDCHSYETKYPWYFNVSPVSHWLKGHVNGGRQNLNFSEWGTYTAEKKSHNLEECVEVIEGKEMPMASYMLGHPEARLSDDQRTALANFFKGVSGNTGKIEDHDSNNAPVSDEIDDDDDDDD